MRVLWADVTGEMELSGTSPELLRLAGELRLGQGGCRLDRSGDPAPYSRALSLIKINAASGAVSISVSSDRETLDIQGGGEALAMLASTVENFAANGDSSDHLHLEYLPGHEFLSHNSEPLVVALIE
jgi:hypothetical protein